VTQNERHVESVCVCVCVCVCVPAVKEGYDIAAKLLYYFVLFCVYGCLLPTRVLYIWTSSNGTKHLSSTISLSAEGVLDYWHGSIVILVICAIGTAIGIVTLPCGGLIVFYFVGFVFG
jgi:hypothetical protein